MQSLHVKPNWQSSLHSPFHTYDLSSCFFNLWDNCSPDSRVIWIYLIFYMQSTLASQLDTVNVYHLTKFLKDRNLRVANSGSPKVAVEYTVIIFRILWAWKSVCELTLVIAGRHEFLSDCCQTGHFLAMGFSLPTVDNTTFFL